MRLVKREAIALINSLGAGVVPRTGLAHIAVGRLREIAAIKHDFDHVRDGGGTLRFIIGRYGSGKSFLLQLARAYAMENRFVVADADFSPERRLHGSDGQGLAMYKELIRNLSTQTRPDGNALPAIIERWISTIQTTVMTNQHFAIGSDDLADATRHAIVKTLDTMEELVHGFDFGAVIRAYYDGYLSSNDGLKSSAIRWLRGEFGTKTEARHALGVRSIIDDSNYYDYLKVLSRFIHDIGYNGLILCLDEAVNLYKITNATARIANYEQLLSIVNDMLQGRSSHMGFLIGGTPEFLQDQRRGLYSYEALRSRLVGNRFASDELQDFSGPVLLVSSLAHEELYVLLQKVRDVHASYHTHSSPIDDAGLVLFMETSLRRVGAAELLTPRELIREFIGLLNILVQYPDTPWQDLVKAPPSSAIGSDQAAEPSNQADPLDRFTHFRVP